MVDAGRRELEQVGEDWGWKGKWETRVKREGCNRRPFPGEVKGPSSFWGYLPRCRWVCTIPLVSGWAWSTLVLGKRTFPWGSSWSKTPQPQKHGLSLCYLLASTEEVGQASASGPPFLQLCAMQGLAAFEPQSPRISEMSRELKPLSERQCPVSWQWRPCMVKWVEAGRVWGGHCPAGTGGQPPSPSEDN